MRGLVMARSSAELLLEHRRAMGLAPGGARAGGALVPVGTAGGRAADELHVRRHRARTLVRHGRRFLECEGPRLAATLFGLWVEPERRRGRVGSQLMQAVMD
jgi:hypothetical protein